jgi:hypothetical protein
MTLARQKAIFEQAEIIAQSAHNWSASFIQLDVHSDSDHGESLRL